MPHPATTGAVQGAVQGPQARLHAPSASGPPPAATTHCRFQNKAHHLSLNLHSCLPLFAAMAGLVSAARSPTTAAAVQRCCVQRLPRFGTTAQPLSPAFGPLRTMTQRSTRGARGPAVAAGASSEHTGSGPADGADPDEPYEPAALRIVRHAAPLLAFLWCHGAWQAVAGLALTWQVWSFFEERYESSLWAEAEREGKQVRCTWRPCAGQCTCTAAPPAGGSAVDGHTDPACCAPLPRLLQLHEVGAARRGEMAARPFIVWAILMAGSHLLSAAGVAPPYLSTTAQAVRWTSRALLLAMCCQACVHGYKAWRARLLCFAALRLMRRENAERRAARRRRGGAQ